ncbi:MAG: MFS transporter [Opitutales bacterium]|nr:MFS transporter [Opitutales bacterium]
MQEKEPALATEDSKESIPFPNPPFIRYIIGEAISMTGTWMQAMAHSWVVVGLTTSAVMVGWVNLAGGLPVLALSMIGGLYADRYDKRAILQICQVVQIFFSLLLGYLVAQGDIQIWHIILASFLLGISGAFEMPAAAAIVPELVGRANVAKAVAFDRAVFHGTRLIGPALAGFIVGHYGASFAYYINALSFLALMIALLTLPKRAKGTVAQEEKRKHGIGEGFRHVINDRPSFAMILLMATNTVFVFPVMVILLPLYAKYTLQLEPQQLGWLMLSSGLGSLTGSIAVPFVKHKWRPNLIILAVTLICIALLSLSMADVFLWAAGSLVCLALGVSTLIGISNIVIQERAPEEIRGRVSAVASLSFFGLLPFAGMVTSVLADVWGMRPTLLTSACAYALIGIGVLSWIGKAASHELEK